MIPLQKFGVSLLAGRSCWLAVGIFAVAMAVAMPAGAQSLKDALEAAYANNPTLGASRAEQRTVDEQVPQALSNWRPQVAVTGSYGKRHLNQESDFFTAKVDVSPARAGVEIAQPLYRGGRTVADTERAEFTVLSQRARVRSVTQDVLLRAVQAYADVWRDQAVLQLNVNNEQVLQRQLQAARDRFEVGEVTRTDVAQSESRLAAARAGRIAAEGNLRASRAVFTEVTGLAAGTLERPDPFGDLPPSLDEAIARAQANNPNVVAADYAERAAAKEIRRVLGEFLPTAELVGRFEHSEESTSKASESDTAEILAQVRIPLYQSGLVSSRVREAKQRRNQRRIEVEEARRNSQQQAVSAWENLQSARAQTDSFEANVRSADIALEGVRQENVVGARTVLDVLDAEQELLDAQVNLVRAQRDSVVASFRLLQAVGRLDAGELGLAVDIYDPTDYYDSVRNKWIGGGAPMSE